MTLLFVEPLKPSRYARLYIGNFSLRATFDFPSQLFFTWRYTEQFCSHDQSIVMFSIVSEIINEAMNQMSGVVSNMALFRDAKNGTLVEEQQ